MIEVRVGEEDEERIFHVHKELLVQHSDFFAAALGGDWKERVDRSVKLPEDDPEQFDHFCCFLYTGQLFTRRSGDRYVDGDGDDCDNEFERICHAWVFGNKLQSTTYKDAVADSLIMKVIDGKFHPVSMHEEIENHAARSAPFRTLLIDIAVHCWRNETFEELR